MSDLTKLSIKNQVEGLRAKKFSSQELVEEYIKNIEDNARLNAFITPCFDLAREKAKISDQNIESGKAGDLEGIPLGIKDNYCTKDIRTTCASKILENFIPTYESTVSQKLLDAGSINIGKLNMDEFAMGSANVNSYFGGVINPYRRKDCDIDLVPGGSSGGSAAAVAANLCAGATGSDTGGSIRQPASYTNTVGIKPTYGRCSRYGIIAFASSLDQAGVFAKDVYDAALLQRVISGYDVKDSTSVAQQVPDFEKLINSDVKGKRIGFAKEYRVDHMPEEIERIWKEGRDLLEKKGAKIVDISLPHTQYAPATYYIIATAECSSNLARYDGVRYGFRANLPDLDLDELYKKTRSEGFGDEVKRRILTGTYVLSAEYYDAYYRKALKFRRLILQDFQEAFKEVDVILTPTTPTAAFSVKDSHYSDPVKMYLNDAFTIPANLAGLPAMSVPFGMDNNGLPIGLQLIANHFDEQTLFDVGSALEI